MALEAPSPVHRFTFPSFDPEEEKPALAAKPQVPAQAAEPAPPPGPLPLPLQLPAITEKDVQQARIEAQAAGYREGYAAAQTKFEKEGNAREEAVKRLLEIIANRITLAAEMHSRMLRERESLMAKIVIASARKVAGDALKREPYAPVESLMRECLGLIAGMPKITITVSAALAPGLRQRTDALKPLLNGFEGEIAVQEDAALLDQDCRVEWGNGRGERDTEAIWTEIEAIVLKTNAQG